MKVLLNLITADATIDKRIVTEWVLRYMERHSEDSCIIFTSEDLKVDHNNLRQVILDPPHNSSAFLIWKRFSLDPLIKKQDHDLIVTWESLRKSVSGKQILILSPIDPSILDRKKSNRKPALKWLDKVKDQCKKLIVFSELEKKWLIRNYPALESKTQVIYRIPAPSGLSLDFDEREIIKEKFADGKEFFLAPANLSPEALKIVLKGFSGFKKWQKSGMEMLLSYDRDEEATEITTLLKNYRFRDSVKLIHSAEKEFSKIIAAAYATILIERFDSDLDFLFAAMHSCVPVLIPEGSVYAELAGNAGLSFFANDKESVTKALLHVFKEEKLRSQKIQEGKVVAEKWKANKPEEDLFQNIS